MISLIIGVVALGLSFAWTIDAATYIIGKIDPQMDAFRKSEIAGGVLGLMLLIFLLKFIFADYSNPDTALDGVGHFLLFWVVSVSIINLIKKFDK